jgi:M3 family oligoendopeptidase
MQFDQMTVVEPRLDDIRTQYAELTRAFEDAADAAARRAVIERWDDLRKRLDTWRSLVHVHFCQDTRDEERKERRERADAMSPKLREFDTAFMKTLLASEHRAELESEIGEHAFALWENDISTFDPAIEDDLVKESNLDAEYTELLSSAKIEFKGETLNLPGLGKYFESSERETRHGAYRAFWNWFAGHGEKLDRIYDELVKLRDGMAKKLGDADFVELGYRRMTRIDYDRNDVERFRDQVRDVVVPLVVKIRERQREKLGLDRLMMWDEPVFDPSGNPKPQGDHDWMVARATEMFDQMGGGLGEFWKVMRERHLIDLKTREGKAGGGFCTSFPEYGVPFIYANFNGTKGDVEVFTHEMGHAFQGWSSRNLPLLDYHWPTSESCEIHSMSLEFLTYPHMEKFFDGDADRFRTIHLTGALTFLPYGVAVDHFQHLVYEKPDATPEERHGMWREVEAIYMPWRDYGDLEYPKKGAFWQRQLHIYGSPFYYIDYTLAQVCALQFWTRAEADRSEAMDAYVKLCARGGEAPFQQLAKGAGLKSPFEAGALDEVAARSASVLGL